MSAINRIVLLLMIVCLSLSTVSAEGFSDTMGTEFEYKVNLVTKLGIMAGGSDDSFGVSEDITRKEFAMVVAKILGFDESNFGGEALLYKDVDESHPSWPSIKLMFDLGVMVGFEDATFRPDDTIKVEEGVKTLVAALGYDELAKSQGGYPIGYFSVALSKGIISSASVSTGRPMTRGEAAVIAANALEAPALVLTAVGEMFEYKEQKGINLLSESFDIYKSKGVVMASGDVSLFSIVRNIAENEAIIDDMIYNKGDLDLENQLGQTIEFYYHEDEHKDTKTLIYIHAKESWNDVIYVTGENVSENTTLNVFHYTDENGTLQKVSISSNSRVVYNGKALTTPANVDIMPETGEVTLIDSDQDGSFETIIVWDYKTYVVDTVVATTGTVRDKYTGETIKFPIDESDYIVRFYKDGEEDEVSSIAKDNILSVAFSKNINGKKLIRAYISSDTVSGELTALYDGSNEVLITVGSEEYLLNAEYVKRYQEGEVLDVGTEYVFYLDIYGNVAAAMKDMSSGSNFAYLMAGGYTRGLERTVQLKLFTSDTNIGVYNLSSKVSHDGALTDASQVFEKIRRFPNDPVDLSIEPQLLQVQINSENEIYELNTALDYTQQSDIGEKDEFVLNKVYGENKRVYKRMLTGSPYAIGTDTLIFEVPEDTSKENEFSIGKSFTTDDTLMGKISLYNVGTGGVVGVLLIVATDVEGGKFTTPEVVEKITDVLDEDGMPAKRINFSGGSSVICEKDLKYEPATTKVGTSYISWGYDDVRIEHLKEGDVIQYRTRGNKASSIKVLAVAQNLGNYRIDEDTILENGSQLVKVVSVSEDRRFMVVEYNNKQETRQLAGSVRKYNFETQRVEPSSLQEVQAGDTVFLNTFWLSTRMVVIYR